MRGQVKFEGDKVILLISGILNDILSTVNDLCANSIASTCLSFYVKHCKECKWRERENIRKKFKQC